MFIENLSNFRGRSLDVADTEMPVGSELDFETLLQESLEFDALVPYTRHAVVIDTNIVIQTLIWMAKNRRDTTLVRLAKSQKVIVWFPEFGLSEVVRHLRVVAEKAGVSVSDATRLWNNDVFPYVRIAPPTEMVAPSHLESQLKQRDPNDLQFLRTFYALNADYLVSRDNDLTSLSITPNDPVTLWLDLRKYHAGQTLRMQIEVGGTILTIVGASAIYGLFAAIKLLASLFSKSPMWVKIVVALVIGAAFAVPSSRKYIVKHTKPLATSVSRALQENKESIGELLKLAFEHLSQAAVVENEAKAKLDAQQSISPSKPRTVKDYALHVLARSPSAMTTVVLAQRIQKMGFRTKNERFSAYVARVLSADDRFHKLPDGLWTLETRSATYV